MKKQIYLQNNDYDSYGGREEEEYEKFSPNLPIWKTVLAILAIGFGYWYYYG